jgi:hypothetical protein
MNRRLALAALATALMFAPVACSSGGSAPTAASPSPNGVQQELAAARRFSQCARAHGHPAFPDPVINDDGIDFGDSTDNARDARKSEIGALEKIPECKTILTQMRALEPPDPKHNGRRNARPSAAVIQKLQRFAQCIREHGIPNWPDPKSDGSFPLTGLGVGDPKSSPAIRTALDACSQYRAGTQDFGGFS